MSLPRHLSFLLRLGLGGGVLPLGPPHQPHQGGGEAWRKKPFDCQHVDGVTPPGNFLNEYLIQCKRKAIWTSGVKHVPVVKLCIDTIEANKSDIICKDFLTDLIKRSFVKVLWQRASPSASVVCVSKSVKSSSSKCGGAGKRGGRHNQFCQSGHHMAGINLLKRIHFWCFNVLCYFTSLWFLLTDKHRFVTTNKLASSVDAIAISNTGF